MNSSHPFRQLLAIAGRHWFLVGLLIVIPIGISLGTSRLSATIDGLISSIPKEALTAVVLFLMSVTLDGARLVAALRSPRAVLAAAFVSQAIVPLIAFPMLSLIEAPDLRLGLIIAASVPCTMAAASVWTRLARGNDAVSLLVTLLTNMLCFLITPAWLALFADGPGVAAIAERLSFGSMMQKLIFAAVLPSLLGQLVRLVPAVRRHIDSGRIVFGNTAQGLILFLVYGSAVKAGFQIETGHELPGPGQVILVWACCIVVHLVAMTICGFVGRAIRVDEEDRVAMIFSGSQKTLPIGLMVAQAAGVPLAILPMLMYHGSQLFIDTWVAARIRIRPSSPPPPDADACVTP
ncbi:MAG: bile acid:sodium symporter [Planctomycetaceae bacterium]|nr:bile acid:sodium symporter [Planctomycetaceae bacterium]